MEQQNKTRKSKGGRPTKAIKKDQYLAMKCSHYERRVIEAKAKKVKATVSEYLRQMGLTGKIDIKEITLPGDILAFTATLNHMAASLNQIAKKRNGLDELSTYERADLKVLVAGCREIVSKIKSNLG